MVFWLERLYLDIIAPLHENQFLEKVEEWNTMTEGKRSWIVKTLPVISLGLLCPVLPRFVLLVCFEVCPNDWGSVPDRLSLLLCWSREVIFFMNYFISHFVARVILGYRLHPSSSCHWPFNKALDGIDHLLNGASIVPLSKVTWTIVRSVSIY